MSSCNNIQITCPKCGRKQEFTTWNSLNVSLNPEKKKLLLSGELTRLICDRCHASTEVMYPMLYHDMDRNLMVYFADGKDTGAISILPLGALMKGYQFRITASRNELLEKVWIADANFDDRAMELFKLSLRGQMENTGGGELLFCGTSQNADGQDLLSFVWLTAQGSENIAVERGSYIEFAEGVAEVLKQEPALSGEWHRIDQKYAKSLLNKYLAGE
jgi:hypothetical protein